MVFDYLGGSKISYKDDTLSCYDQSENNISGISEADCLSSGNVWKRLNNPVPVDTISEIRYDQLYYVDPLNDTLMSSVNPYTPSNKTADDVHSGVLTANGNVPIAIRDCTDPIILEKNHFFTAEGINADDSDIKSGDPYRFQQKYKTLKSSNGLNYKLGMTKSVQNMDINNIQPLERVFNENNGSFCLNREHPSFRLISEEQCNNYSSSPNYSGPGTFPSMPANNVSVHTSMKNSCAINKANNSGVCWGENYGSSPQWSAPAKTNVRYFSTGGVEEDYETVTPQKKFAVDTSNNVHCNFDYNLGNSSFFANSWFDGEILSYSTAYLNGGTGMCKLQTKGLCIVGGEMRMPYLHKPQSFHSLATNKN